MTPRETRVLVHFHNEFPTPLHCRLIRTLSVVLLRLGQKSFFCFFTSWIRSATRFNLSCLARSWSTPLISSIFCWKNPPMVPVPPSRPLLFNLSRSATCCCKKSDSSSKSSCFWSRSLRTLCDKTKEQEKKRVEISPCLTGYISLPLSPNCWQALLRFSVPWHYCSMPDIRESATRTRHPLL